MTEVAEQPMPVPNDSTDIQSLVIADVTTRRQVGIERYGTPLQAHNGRDALRDAYEEALDLACYLRQAIEERDQPQPEVYRYKDGSTIPIVREDRQRPEQPARTSAGTNWLQPSSTPPLSDATAQTATTHAPPNTPHPPPANPPG